MAEHKRTSKKKQDESDRTHRAGQKESQPYSEKSHLWGQATLSIGETPFSPRIDKHAELIAMATSDEAKTNLILNLQQTYGNKYVQGLLNSKVLQAKLAVSNPDDVYEQEADRVADMVTRRIASETQRQPEQEEEEIKAQRQDEEGEEEEEEEIQTQRQEEEGEEEEEEEEEEIQAQRQTEEEDEEEEPAQTKAELETQRQELLEEGLQAQTAESHATTASDNLESSISSAIGGGKPLPEDVKKPMEQAFRADFSGVRVHTDSEADKLNRQLSAKAFTTGKDIFFRESEYSPASESGRKLIAHELTHVVQQTTGAKLLPEEQETGELTHEGIAEGTVQRKTKDIHIDKRLYAKYTKRVNVQLDELIALINGYNSFSIKDTNYDLHLAQLRAIQQKSWYIERMVEDWKGFLNKRGTWRSLGGPFRLHYAWLVRNLRKLAGYYLQKDRYKGTVTKEIEKVEKQKERGLEINA
jgi:chemotaxis protein histidine kinase CheA